ncbi:hypothetical protein DPMN_126103 [Dreissena polymorpha]|uniref:Uncharacterized protein n=1 Tax=Dreissena polymorpha TaxID=45954 RepID=A0A9D4JVA8_DREPO|nr:hypothetical protein DPMN_126103 [Dreissena polymorpha]
MNGEKLDEITNFKLLGATLSNDGYSRPDARIRIATATVAFARLSRLSTSSSLSFPS